MFVVFDYYVIIEKTKKKNEIFSQLGTMNFPRNLNYFETDIDCKKRSQYNALEFFF